MASPCGKPTSPRRSRQPGYASRTHRGAREGRGTLNVKLPEWDAPAAAPGESRRGAAPGPPYIETDTRYLRARSARRVPGTPPGHVELRAAQVRGQGTFRSWQWRVLSRGGERAAQAVMGGERSGHMKSCCNRTGMTAFLLLIYTFSLF